MSSNVGSGCGPAMSTVAVWREKCTSASVVY
jgi:hypothetical protein